MTWRCLPPSLGLLVALAVAGCVRLAQPAPSLRTYRLDYVSPAPVTPGPQLAAVLRVQPFGVASVYDRDTLLFREAAHTINAYFYDRWSTNPGAMVSDLLARDLADSGLYRNVQVQASVVNPTYILDGEIEEIAEVQDNAECSAHLRIRISLDRVRNTAGGASVFQRNYGDAVRSACGQPEALVAALSAILQGISQRLQQDLYDAITVASPRS